MLLYTGMRPSELLALEDHHVRLDRTTPVVGIRGTVHDPTATTPGGLPRRASHHRAEDRAALGPKPPHGPKRPHGASYLFRSSRSSRRDRHGRSQPLTLDGLKAMLADLGANAGIKGNP